MDIEVYEKINLANLKKVRSKCDNPDLCSKLDSLLKYAKPLKKGGTIGINKIELKNEFVRAYPKNRPTVALLRKDVKSFILVDDTYDFDIVNCHPTILRNICKKNSISCPLLDDYVEHRDKWLAKGITKNEMTFSLYGTSVPTRHNDVELFRVEANLINKLVCGLDDYKKVVNFSKLAKNNPKKESVISYILQSEELVIMMNVMKTVQQAFPTVQLNTYEYDGCRYGIPNDVSKDDVLTTMNSVASQYDVRFIIKAPAKHNFDLDDDDSSDVENDEEEIDDLTAYERVIHAFPGIIRKWNGKIWAFDVHTGQWSIQTVSDPYVWFNLCKAVHINNAYGRFTKRMLDAYKMCVMLQDASAFFKEAEMKTVGKLLYKDAIWDIENSCVLPFSHEYLFTIKIDRNIPKERDEFHINKLYKAIFEDTHPNIKTRNELIKGLAVALTGNNKDRKIWINLGGTGTGKSTLLNLLTNAYQGYFITLKAQNFVLQKNVDANEHCGWLSDLRYTRIAMTSECPNNIRLDGNLLKTISGGDPVQSRKMYVNPESHGIQATIFMMANALSPIEPMDEAMKDRVSAIPWNVQFKKMENRDTTICDYIKQTHAHDALFFLLQDAYNLYTQEGFCQVEEIDDFTKTFTDEQDQFKQLFEDKFEVGGASDMMLTEHVYRLFKSYSNSQSHVAQKLLNDYGVKKEQKRNAEQWVGAKMCFVGIKLKEEMEFIGDY